MIQRSIATILPLLATGCLECEEVVREVRYLPSSDAFHVQTRLRNLDAGALECAAVQPCVERIRSVVQRPETVDLLGHLLEQGASDLSARVERGAAGLDLVVDYVAPLGTRAADDTGVFLEVEHGLLWERQRLVVEVDEDGATVEARGKRERTRFRAGDQGLDYSVSWVVRPRRPIVVHVPGQGDVTPILGAIDGLEAALVQAGLLEPS